MLHDALDNKVDVDGDRPDKLICCELNCSEKAEWVITDGDGPDGSIHSCTKHVGHLLDYTKINIVTDIETNA